MKKQALYLTSALLSLSVLGPLAAQGAESSEAQAQTQPEPEPTAKAKPADAFRGWLQELRTLSDRAGIAKQKKPSASEPQSSTILLKAAPFELALYADQTALFTPLGGQTGWPEQSGSYSFQEHYLGLQLPKPVGQLKHPATKSAAEYFERFLALGDKSSKLPAELLRSAEVIRYTLDENSDGKINLDDRKGSEASKTSDPSDNTLVRHRYGVKLSDGAPKAVHEQAVVLSEVYVYLHENDSFEALPKPLFSYTLSERFAQFDLNGDGDMDDELLFGDSDGDGRLSDAELKKLYASAQGEAACLTSQLEIDARFASKPGENEAEAKPSLKARLKEKYPHFTDEAIKHFLLGATIRADISLVVEYFDEARGAQVRQRTSGAADFRNTLMRLRGLTR